MNRSVKLAGIVFILALCGITQKSFGQDAIFEPIKCERNEQIPQPKC